MVMQIVNQPPQRAIGAVLASGRIRYSAKAHQLDAEDIGCRGKHFIEQPWDRRKLRRPLDEQHDLRLWIDTEIVRDKLKCTQRIVFHDYVRHALYDRCAELAMWIEALTEGIAVE